MKFREGPTKVKMSSELKERLTEQPITFGVLGPIGAGKSTISKLLGERLGVPVIEERFSENPFLENFYANPKEWSYKSQTWFLTEKIKQLSELDFSRSQIIDPALEMDLIYAQTLHKIGFMEQREFNLYKDTFDGIYDYLKEEGKIKKPDIFLVVNAPSSVLEKRIRERGRPYELVMLRKYPSYLANLKRNVEMFKGCQVCIDAKDDSFTNQGNVSKLVEEIRKKLIN